MTTRSLTTRLANVEEQLAYQGLHDEDDDRPPMPLFLRVALRDVLRGWEGPEEPGFVAVMAQLPGEVHDRILDFTDLINPGCWLDDGLGHVDENQLPEDAAEVVAQLYQQRQQEQEQPPHLAQLPAVDEPEPEPEPMVEYGLKEMSPPPPDEPTPAAVAVPPAPPEPEPVPPRHVLTFPSAGPSRNREPIFGVPEHLWKKL
jgi:hypothetical protein